LRLPGNRDLESILRMTKLAQRVKEAYVPYMESIFAFF